MMMEVGDEDVDFHDFRHPVGILRNACRPLSSKLKWTNQKTKDGN